MIIIIIIIISSFIMEAVIRNFSLTMSFVITNYFVHV